jgi:hypothetical protein
MSFQDGNPDPFWDGWDIKPDYWDDEWYSPAPGQGPPDFSPFDLHLEGLLGDISRRRESGEAIPESIFDQIAGLGNYGRDVTGLVEGLSKEVTDYNTTLAPPPVEPPPVEPLPVDPETEPGFAGWNNRATGEYLVLNPSTGLIEKRYTTPPPAPPPPAPPPPAPPPVDPETEPGFAGWNNRATGEYLVRNPGTGLIEKRYTCWLEQ